MCGAAIDTQEDTANSNSKELEGSGASAMTVNENGDENARAVVDDQLNVDDKETCDDTKEQAPGGLDTSTDDTDESGCGYESSVSPSPSFDEDEVETEPNEEPNNENVNDDDTDENSEFAQLCRSLERNDDASLISVSIFDFGCLSHPRKALALSSSLRRNTTVRTLHLDFGAVTKWNVHADAAFVWTEFLQTTSNSGITALELHQATSPLSCQRRRRTSRQQDDGAAACTLLLVILQAISKNASITELTFSNNSSNSTPTKTPALPTATMAPTKSSPSSSTWYFTSQIPTTLQTATLQALTECRFIDTLWLEHVEDSVVGAMLSQLHQNRLTSTDHKHKLQSLVIVPQRRTLSMATAKALGSLLSSSSSSSNSSSSSLRHIEFHGVRFTFKIVHCLFMATTTTTTTNASTDQEVNVGDHEPLSSLSTGLELSMYDCTFDWAATNWVRTHLGQGRTRVNAPTTNIETWTIGRNVRFYGTAASVVAAVVSAPTCGIATLDLTRCDWGVAAASSAAVAAASSSGLIALLTALEARVELLTKTTGTIASTATGSTTTSEDKSATAGAAVGASGRMLERLLLGTLVKDDVSTLQRYIPSLRGLQYLQFQLVVVEGVDNTANNGEESSAGTKDLAVASTGKTGPLSHPHHELLTALQANTTLATCVINDETLNLFQYPNQELSIYDQIMQGLL